MHSRAGTYDTNKVIAIILWKFHNDDAGMWNANSCGIPLIVWNIGDFIDIKHPKTQNEDRITVTLSQNV